MADYLCDEIIIAILHRLPVKTLVRCTVVCKSWYSLITSPPFISSHLNFAAFAAGRNKAPLLLLRRRLRCSERYDLFSDDYSFTPHSNLEFPFRSINSFFTIVGSCNGLFCLSDDRVYHTHTVILWNPCIRKSVLLPKPDPVHYNPYGTFTQSLGFGFNPVASDYKVIRITYADRVRVQLYKLSTGVWQDMDFLSLDQCVIYNKSRQAYVNGATHWVARYMDYHDSIVFFDMCSEVFGIMMLPVGLSNDDNNNDDGTLMRNKDLVVYNESLALIMWSVSGAEPTCSVWVMNEYGVQESWTKHLTFDFHDFGGRLMKPLWVRKRGGVVMVRQDGRLVSCDPDGGGGEVMGLGVVGSRSEEYRRSVHVDSYVESLVLLEKAPNYSSDALACRELPSLHASDCDSGGSCGSEYECNSGSDCKRNHL